MEQIPFNPQERVESLKVGILSASVATFVFAAWLVVNEWLAQWPIMVGVSRWAVGDWMSLSGSLAGAAISGFLFGVTYRYAIRQDTNPQPLGMTRYFKSRVSSR